MKKIVTLLLAMVMICGLMAVGAYADGAATISVSADKSDVVVGDTVNVTVSISNNPGIEALQFRVKYDKTHLEYVTGSYANKLTGGMESPLDEANLGYAWIAMMPVSTNGDVAVFTFKALDNVGASDISVEIVAFGTLANQSMTCNVSGTTVNVKTHDHIWDAGTVTPPTCSKEGYTTYKCTVTGCTETKVENKIPATGEHKFVETERKEATCKDDGYIKYVCDCGETKTETIPATGEHKFVETERKEATCKDDGYVKYACECGETKEDKIPATGDHNFVVEVERVDATCEADGYVKYACGCGTPSEDATVLPELGHKFENYTETTAPTCTEKGEKTATCANGCDETDTKEIPAKGHAVTDKDFTVITAPTCTEKGEATATCPECDVTLSKEVAALGHSWGNWKVTKEATKTEKGEKVRVCEAEGCDATETKEIPATGSVAPKTGDEANIALYAVMFMMAAAGVVVLSLKKKEN